MAYVHVVMMLALAEFLAFGWAVGRARGRYNVPAPATTGHEVFERYYRVQMNTLEQLIIFVPSMQVFGRYVNAYVAAALGVLFIVGRAVYFRGYVSSPERRHLGFGLSAIPNMVLLIGAILGPIRAIIAGP
jgi:glutathione S-transferase